MKIALFCATARGLRFLEALRRLAPDAQLTLFSFREEPWEPRFLEDIRAAAGDATLTEVQSIGEATFVEATGGEVDLLLAISWRYMIPPSVVARARGAFLVHDSLLPAYRGFAPTVWAIANGEDHTGATLLRMGERVDEGDIVAQKRVPIGEADTIATVMERVTLAYLDLLEENWQALRDGSAQSSPQDHARATYGCKRLPDDARIDWNRSSKEILNLIRASTHPYPGAFTTVEGRKLTIWSAAPLPPDFPRYAGRIPGRVAGREGDGVVVFTGDGGVVVREVQLEDGGRAAAATVLVKLSSTLR